jgi:N-acetylmuramoyl-L-alanine amidase
MKRENWIVFAPFYLLVVIIFLGIAHVGSETVTTINQRQPVARQHRIIIDAGHGGVDGGATSCTGVLESHINLEIALRLENVFHLLGYDTVMIRRTDESVYTQGNTIASQKVSDLKERVRIVNETPGAILVSIHQNTYSDSRYRGAQVFYGKDAQGKTLAQTMQQNIISTLNSGSQRKSKQAKGVYLMENISVPGILIECAFLTNPEEEALIRDGDYQKKLCAVIGSTVSSWLATS